MGGGGDLNQENLLNIIWVRCICMGWGGGGGGSVRTMEILYVCMGMVQYEFVNALKDSRQ